MSVEYLSRESSRSSASSKKAIVVKDLHAYYGESHILHGLSFAVSEGEVLTLLGRNGGGRTTIIRSIMGLVERRRGSIEILGRETISAAPFQIARLGVGYCPEDRGIFASLSCLENLELPPAVDGKGMTLEAIYALFPNLAKRLHTPGTRLSGGEQQMLAIARILRTGARILLLDEISEGLAPAIVDGLAATITKLRDLGYTILMVEQNLEFAAPIADRFLVIERGRIVMEVTAADLERRISSINHYLGV
jgi:branched-chain amino acid transport system ATP-binding protein